MMHVARLLLDVLFASLWQDALIGICVALLLLFAGKRLNASTRHVVLQCALLAMIAVPIATTLSNMDASSVTQSGHSVAGPSLPNALLPTEERGSIVRRVDLILGDRTVLALVVLWIAGLLVFGLRIALGFAQVSRLVRGSERIADRMGVPVYASHRITVPIAFGLLSPAIAVPDVLAREDGDELDCVLSHELGARAPIRYVVERH